MSMKQRVVVILVEEEEGGDVDGQRLMHEDADVGKQKRARSSQLLQQIKKLMQRDEVSELSEDDTDKGAGAFEKKNHYFQALLAGALKIKKSVHR